LGDAAEEILKYVRSEGIDLIIMGTHGRKGLEKIVFGSVAERVVQKSPVPVLTINPYGKAA
jgi:nucleotide-binding universal stress UspA family protein